MLLKSKDTFTFVTSMSCGDSTCQSRWVRGDDGTSGQDRNPEFWESSRNRPITTCRAMPSRDTQRSTWEGMHHESRLLSKWGRKIHAFV